MYTVCKFNEFIFFIFVRVLLLRLFIEFGLNESSDLDPLE